MSSNFYEGHISHHLFLVKIDGILFSLDISLIYCLYSDYNAWTTSMYQGLVN